MVLLDVKQFIKEDKVIWKLVDIHISSEGAYDKAFN
jgi:hypothetical protein